MIDQNILSIFFSFCEIYRSRGIASGLAAALTYILGSIAKKTYYNLEISLSMPGVTLLYCIIAAVGLVWTYNILPETENRSLDDIERHFSDNSKKLTDRYIPISKSIGSKENSEKANEISRNGIKSTFENGGFDSTKVWNSLTLFIGLLSLYAKIAIDRFFFFRFILIYFYPHFTIFETQINRAIESKSV